MSAPIILSDEEPDTEDPNTPLPKKPRTEPGRDIPTIFLIEDDPTPQKPLPVAPASIFPPFPPSSSSSRFDSLVVPETPASDISIVECSVGPSAPQARVSASGICPKDLSGIMCLESDEDEPGSGPGKEIRDGNVTAEIDVEDFSPSPPRFWCSQQMLGDMRSTSMSWASSSQQTIVEDCAYQIEDGNKQNFTVEESNELGQMNEGTFVDLETKLDEDKPVRKRKTNKGEREQLREEQKQRKEQEKLQKAALKAQEKLQKEALKVQAAEMKKLENEKKKWETGKFALKAIVAEVDAKVVEQGSIGV